MCTILWYHVCGCIVGPAVQEAATVDDRVGNIAVLLLAHREDAPQFWTWLSPGLIPSRKDANKFLLASILDYQIPYQRAWDSARRLSEDILGDPDDIWRAITSVPLEEWTSRRREYSLHRYSKAHERVWTIGKRIVDQYDGDARRIWDGQTVEGTLYRLNGLRVGEQISRMVAGALLDTGLVEGPAQVKADVNVRRVLGRAVQGREYPFDDTVAVTDLTQRMHPENPWQLDRSLFTLGTTVCRAHDPVCYNCYLSSDCRCAAQAGIVARAGDAQSTQNLVAPNPLSAVPFFRVADIAASVAFYTGGLGFTITRRWAPGGLLRWCRLERAGTALMLQQFETSGPDAWVPASPVGVGVSICFVCADALALYRAFRAAGLNPSRPVVSNGMWLTALSDPDGYRLEFESPTDAAEGTQLDETPAP